MRLHSYILGQFKLKIQLFPVPYNNLLNVGEKFDHWEYGRDESWTIIKVFKGFEYSRIEALIALINLTEVKQLFAIDLPEVKSYKQEYRDSVSNMAGEA
jgi:hypothetical protein